jgi:hypothetical protein
LLRFLLSLSAVGLALGSVPGVAADPHGNPLGSLFSPRPRLELNTEYPAPGEDEEFAGFAVKINQLQELNQKSAPDGAIHRGFHAKAHGCLHGEMEVLADRDPQTRFGIFEPTRSYPVWIRFSNAQGTIGHDTSPDLRGMAIKVLDVPGDKILPDERTSKAQDFLMTNQAATFVPDAKGFMEFAEDTANGRIAWYFAKHPIIAVRILRETTRKVPSLLTTQFWSGGAFRLGDRASKFTAVPCPGLTRTYPRHAPATYLTDDLVATVGSQETCYDFYVQFQLDPYQQPIENASVEWKTPWYRVARIHIPAQVFNSPAQAEFCENLSFTPWHALPAHQPLGNINRARKTVYESSRSLRQNGQPAVEPTGLERF